MAIRRLSLNQIMTLIEGAEMVGQATGLSVSEVVKVVLSEPDASAEADIEEPTELRKHLSAS